LELIQWAEAFFKLAEPVLADSARSSSRPQIETLKERLEARGTI